MDQWTVFTWSHQSELIAANLSTSDWLSDDHLFISRCVLLIEFNKIVICWNYNCSNPFFSLIDESLSFPSKWSWLFEMWIFYRIYEFEWLNESCFRDDLKWISAWNETNAHSNFFKTSNQQFKRVQIQYKGNQIQ